MVEALAETATSAGREGCGQAQTLIVTKKKGHPAAQNKKLKIENYKKFKIKHPLE